MKTHELKTWPAPFAAVWAGAKTCEIRQDDGRGYDKGDTLYLREWDPALKVYSYRSVRADVTWIARGPEWGLPPGMCVMSIRVHERSAGSVPDKEAP